MFFFFRKGSKIEGKRISYGPYKNVSPYSLNLFECHYLFEYPWLTMTTVFKDVEISHWGNVRIEESYQMKHDGSELKGSYEVGPYDRIGSMANFGNMAQIGASVNKLKATLPKGAYGVYYVDRIGNISTSNFRQGKTESYLEIKPRYPLYKNNEKNTFLQI